MRRGILAAAVISALAALNALAAPPQITSHLVASAVIVPMDLKQLWGKAETVALVRPTGQNTIHWNNADNRQWESDLGRAMIYNDQVVEVLKVNKGKTSSVLTIRNIGGVVGNVRYEVDGLTELQAGTEYLVFLATFDTPTREGFERAVSFVGQQQGIFAPAAGSFLNPLGLVVDESVSLSP